MLIHAEDGMWYTEDYLWCWVDRYQTLSHRIYICEQFTKDSYYPSKEKTIDYIKEMQKLSLLDQGWGVDGVVECDCGKVYEEFDL